jgi:hypothetical protein
MCLKTKNKWLIISYKANRQIESRFGGAQLVQITARPMPILEEVVRIASVEPEYGKIH